MYISTLIFCSHILFNGRIVLEDPMLLKAREKSLNVRQITLFIITSVALEELG